MIFPGGGERENSARATSESDKRYIHLQTSTVVRFHERRLRDSRNPPRFRLPRTQAGPGANAPLKKCQRSTFSPRPICLLDRNCGEPRRVAALRRSGAVREDSLVSSPFSSDSSLAVHRSRESSRASPGDRSIEFSCDPALCRLECSFRATVRRRFSGIGETRRAGLNGKITLESRASSERACTGTPLFRTPLIATLYRSRLL